MAPVAVSLGKTHPSADHPQLNLMQVALNWGFCAHLVLCTLVTSVQRRQQWLSAEIYFCSLCCLGLLRCPLKLNNDVPLAPCFITPWPCRYFLLKMQCGVDSLWGKEPLLTQVSAALFFNASRILYCLDNPSFERTCWAVLIWQNRHIFVWSLSMFQKYTKILNVTFFFKRYTTENELFS